MTPVADQWYVQFNGQPYGPFTYGQMQEFVAEERVIAASLITPDPTRGYFQAIAFPVFAQWLSAKTPSQAVQSQSTYTQPAQVQPAIQAPQTQSAATQQDVLQLQETSRIGTVQQVQAVAVGQDHHAPQPYVSPSLSVYLVMAEIRSGQDMRFLQILQSYGTAQRIGDTVWLMRGTTTLTALRDALAGTLSQQDRLFLLDTFKNQTAWFNIGADMDTRIRELWGEGK